MESREKIIQNYIAGYNEFDIRKMVKHLDNGVVFENVSNGEVTLSLHGLEAFKEQAELAKSYFATRRQSIKSYNHRADETEIEIAYNALLAIDLPNGLKKGHELELQGKAIFKFFGDNIIKLTDIS